MRMMEKISAVEHRLGQVCDRKAGNTHAALLWEDRARQEKEGKELRENGKDKEKGEDKEEMVREAWGGRKESMGGSFCPA